MAWKADLQELTEIEKHHNDLINSLHLYFTQASPQYAIRFASYSFSEVEKELTERLQEVEYTSILALLAFLEAVFRLDYQKRSQKRLKDPISKALRQIYKQKKEKASLEEDIFETWKKNHTGIKNTIGDLKGAFKLRHWLAHGRYWEPRLGRKKYEFHSLSLLAKECLACF